jgi:hypothetical protein
MALTKLTHHLTKNNARGFSTPSVVTAPSHGASVTVTNVGNAASSPVAFLNGPFTVEDCWVTNEVADIWDVDFILPTPPLSAKIPQGLSSDSTAQEPKKEGNTLSLSDDLKMKAAPLIKLRGQEGPV